MVKNIYTDKETDSYLEQIKTKEPDFVLSTFFKQALLKHMEKDTNDLSVEVLEKKISDLKRQEDQTQSDIKFYENELIKAKVKQARKEEDLVRQIEVQNKKEAQILKGRIEYITYWFKVTEDEAERYAQEFSNLNDPKKNIHKFMLEQGVEEKSEGELENGI